MTLTMFRERANMASWIIWLVVFLMIYALNLTLAIIAGIYLLLFADQYFPNVFFYHQGPLDVDAINFPDPGLILLFIAANYAVFFAFFVPMARIIRMPHGATVILALLNEPAVLIAIVCLAIVH